MSLQFSIALQKHADMLASAWGVVVVLEELFSGEEVGARIAIRMVRLLERRRDGHGAKMWLGLSGRRRRARGRLGRRRDVERRLERVGIADELENIQALRIQYGICEVGRPLSMRYGRYVLRMELLECRADRRQ